MLNNIYYFEYSREHPEKMFDPYYAKNKIIIPTTADEKNILSVNNDRLINLIPDIPEWLLENFIKKGYSYIVFA